MPRKDTLEELCFEVGLFFGQCREELRGVPLDRPAPLVSCLFVDGWTTRVRTTYEDVQMVTGGQHKGTVSS